MKKYIKTIAAILAVCTCVSFAGCSEEKPSSDTSYAASAIDSIGSESTQSKASTDPVSGTDSVDDSIEDESTDVVSDDPSDDASLDASSEQTAQLPVYNTENLTENLKANPVTGKYADGAFLKSQTAFSVELFKLVNKQSDGNVLVSPASVMLALAMTANGADNATLSQMENVLGMPINDLNKYLYQVYIYSKKDDELLNIADSIWIKNDDNLLVNDKFLQTDKDWYDAEIYKAAFDDNTVRDVNNWCSKHTDGMIKKIIDRFYDDEIMHLINAVCFDAAWRDKYTDTDIKDEKFTEENGKKSDVKLMYSHEDRYLKTDNACGFRRSYEGNYSFVAMLPDEGIKINDFVNSLTGEKISDFLSSGEKAEVTAAIPQFEYDFNANLNDELISMGMTNAFDGNKADFSKLGKCKNGDNIYIGFVNHFTHIEVSKDGTRAAAVTDVGMAEATAFDPSTPPHYEVILNRPFVYMIVDNTTNLPVFIGMVTSF